MAGGPGANLPCDSEKAKGSPGLWSLRKEKGRNAENSRVWARLHCLPESTRPACPKRRVGAWAADAGSPGFTFQLRLFPVGWS